MDESLGCMFKLTGPNYLLWKSNMKDFLICKDLYLLLLGDKGKPKDMDDAAWAVWHQKTTAYIRRFIDLSLYHNFEDETKADVLWKKIATMFKMKSALNKAQYSER